MSGYKEFETFADQNSSIVSPEKNLESKSPTKQFSTTNSLTLPRGSLGAEVSSRLANAESRWSEVLKLLDEKPSYQISRSKNEHSFILNFVMPNPTTEVLKYLLSFGIYKKRWITNKLFMMSLLTRSPLDSSIYKNIPGVFSTSRNVVYMRLLIFLIESVSSKSTRKIFPKGKSFTRFIFNYERELKKLSSSETNNHPNRINSKSKLSKADINQFAEQKKQANVTHRVIKTKAEAKLAETKIAETKIAETKIAETKIAETKLAETKVGESRNFEANLVENSKSKSSGDLGMPTEIAKNKKNQEKKEQGKNCDKQVADSKKDSLVSYNSIKQNSHNSSFFCYLRDFGPIWIKMIFSMGLYHREWLMKRLLEVSVATDHELDQEIFVNAPLWYESRRIRSYHKALAYLYLAKINIHVKDINELENVAKMPIVAFMKSFDESVLQLGGK